MPLFLNIVSKYMRLFRGRKKGSSRNRVSRGVAKENGSGKVLLVERIIQSVSEWRIHRERLKVKRSLFDPNRGNYFISSRRYGIRLKRERERESSNRRGKRGKAPLPPKDTIRKQDLVGVDIGEKAERRNIVPFSLIRRNATVSTLFIGRKSKKKVKKKK